MIVGIDASRNRSGGAKTHLVHMLAAGDPAAHGIREVHVWTYAALAAMLPSRSWLRVHTPAPLERGLARQLWWQRFELPGAFAAAKADILLNTDAGTISTVRPCVTMSRDMLSYEPGEIERFGWTKARLRLILLRWAQNRSLRQADGAVFLTRHAADTIQRSCGRLKDVALIPHGVGDAFRAVADRARPFAASRQLKCLYVSNAALHKHQWRVVEAVAALRAGGRDVALILAGGGEGRGQERLNRQLALSDPEGAFVTQLGPVPHHALPGVLADADVFVFASSCENMPNTLVEGMAAGLPIACSDRGPMPEVLGQGGVYFNPERPAMIAAAIRALADDAEAREVARAEARARAARYSWERCADESWCYLAEVAAKAALRRS